MLNRNKIYKYKTQYDDYDLVRSEWEAVKRNILKRTGYRIEVEKIVPRLFGFGHIIHYYFIEEEKDVAED